MRRPHDEIVPRTLQIDEQFVNVAFAVHDVDRLREAKTGQPPRRGVGAFFPTKRLFGPTFYGLLGRRFAVFRGRLAFALNKRQGRDTNGFACCFANYKPDVCHVAERPGAQVVGVKGIFGR